MMELRDYIPVCLVEKKLAILYGNCHMAILEKYLQNQPDFQRQYVIKRYYIGEIEELRRYPSDNILHYCQLLITQDIQSENSFKVPSDKEIIKKTSENCKKIIIPNLYGFNFFFPQAKFMDKNSFKHHIHKSAIDVDIEQPQNHYTKYILTWIIGWRDKNIEYAFESGKNNLEIQDMINNKEVYCRDEIIINFKNQLDKLKQREKECTIKISDFIEENYRIEQLFYDPYHPCNKLIFEKGKRILHFLDIPVEENVVSDDALDDGELFLYGCVRNTLGIIYEQRYIKNHRYRCTLHNHPLNLSEYIEEYLTWYFDE